MRFSHVLENLMGYDKELGETPTLSATSFIFLYLQSLVSIMVSASHWFPANYWRKRVLQTYPNAAIATAAKIASTS